MSEAPFPPPIPTPDSSLPGQMGFDDTLVSDKDTAEKSATENAAVEPTAEIARWETAPGVIRNVAYPMAFVSGIAWAFLGVSSFFSSLPTIFWLFYVIAPSLLVLGLVWLCNAFRRQESLAWYAQIGLSLLGIINMPQIILQDIPVGIIINIGILCFWFRSDTRAWFGLPISPRE